MDCHGVYEPTSDYTSDAIWREQTDRLRNTLRGDFDQITLLADSLEFARTPASGFDGIGIYDNYIPPEDYRIHAEGASRAGLPFSFNVNPGYDQIEPREIARDSCYSGPRPVAPPGLEPIDWSVVQEHDRVAAASALRITASLQATVDVQTDPRLTNDRRGFFLVYLNSFNEWHEGHAFEPMKDFADLTREERALGYRNPSRGDYRLAALAAEMRNLLQPDPPDIEPRPTTTTASHYGAGDCALRQPARAGQEYNRSSSNNRMEGHEQSAPRIRHHEDGRVSGQTATGLSQAWAAAVRLDPDDGLAWRHLGEIEHRHGRAYKGARAPVAGQCPRFHGAKRGGERRLPASPPARSRQRDRPGGPRARAAVAARSSGGPRHRRP